MEVSNDPYELKLYQMFQSCETQQHCGLLDESSLRKLCALLELRDKGAALISSLAENGGLKIGVSFEQFKEALLNFLGSEYEGSSQGTGNGNITANDSQERSLVISNEVDSTYVESPTESSDREVSPKLVVGSKKYGRRSRPQTHIESSGIDVFSLSDSDITDEEQHRSLNGHEPNNMHVQRSASQTDLPNSRRVRPTQMSSGGTKLKRCSSLPARKQTNKLNTSKSSKTVANTAKQQQRNSSSVESLGYHVHHHPSMQDQEPQEHYRAGCFTRGFGTSYFCKDAITTPPLIETLSAHSIVEIWTQANILNGSGILLSLGFDEDEVNVSQLIKVLEDELRTVEDDSQSNMMRALVTLQSAELLTLRQAYRQLHEENVKLRADNKEASRRVSSLAVEIDERHASLEENTKKQIQLLEQRHSNVLRDYTLRMASDRDNWSNLNGRLEAQIKKFEQEEIKYKTEMELIRRENSELDLEHQKAQKQITELLQKNSKLQQELSQNNEISKSYEKILTRRRGNNSLPGDRDCEGNDHDDDDDDNEEDSVSNLINKIRTLQMVNSNLRDKNDELAIEVENLQHEMLRTCRMKVKKTSQANATDLEDDIDQSTCTGSTSATKRRGDSPSKARITEESPRSGKLRKCGDDSCTSEHSDYSGDWLALNSELQHSTNDGEVEDINALKQRINDLEQQLQNAKSLSNASTATTTTTTEATTTTASSPSTDERIKELETSLEQLRRAYDDCEDYWEAKLSQERQLFEKERHIYEDEQRESDKKFTDLMEKVREYEEQYNRDGRLSPIEERDALEQQYCELEAELSEVRQNSLSMLQEKNSQIDSLQNEIEDLRTRLGESVEILTGATELDNEASMKLNTTEAALSPASSPISYLWHQSTIQEPAKDITSAMSSNMTVMSSPSKLASRNILTTTETTLFSTTPPVDTESSGPTVAPIQKPSRAKSPQQQVQSEGEIADCETSSTASNKSFDTQSILSTHSATLPAKATTSSKMKDELKRLKFFEIKLKDQIKDLSLQRDGLVMELQQLHEARPVLQKAYARTTHPSLIQKVNQLALRNRHLENAINQQREYLNSLLQQSWRQHQMEINELHGRLEAQSVMIAEQKQLLKNNDLVAKDLFVENAQLTASVQRLEQQRARVNFIHQQQQYQQQQQLHPNLLIGNNLNSLPPGLP